MLLFKAYAFNFVNGCNQFTLWELNLSHIVDSSALSSPLSELLHLVFGKCWCFLGLLNDLATNFFEDLFHIRAVCDQIVLNAKFKVHKSFFFSLFELNLSFYLGLSEFFGVLTGAFGLCIPVSLAPSAAFVKKAKRLGRAKVAFSVFIRH